MWHERTRIGTRYRRELTFTVLRCGHDPPEGKERVKVSAFEREMKKGCIVSFMHTTF